MRNKVIFFPVFSLVVALCLAAPTLTLAQTSNVRPRITAAIDETKVTRLQGNTHPLARPQFDRGAAPLSLPMQRMLLVLKRSPDQESALETLMEQQQDASSPNFHKWLTPQQFGQQFGPADQDIQAVTSWLQSHGFAVDRVSNGRTVIEFSGTARQVQEAFHTEIHQFNVNGENHWANSSDPQIPSALAPVVAGINTLHNFPRRALHQLAGVMSRSRTTGELTPVEPLFNFGGNCGVSGVGCHGVSPYDFATIYNVSPLWNATPTRIDGTGQSIAIVSESNLNIQDVRDFRNYFGLPAKDPIILDDGTDPGLTGAETEADLDVQWAGAVAPNATIILVVAQSTESSLGADLAAEYAVNNNVAPILNVSYGICEAALGTSGNQFFNQLWQQAAAQGITVLVASGDSGSAVCDRRGGTPPLPAQFGLQVSGFSSTPYNVAVGGTDFNDLTNPSTFWNSTNSAPPGNPSAPATVSAKSYIPETTWNNTCTNGVFGNPAFFPFSTNPETNCNNPQLVNFVVAVGGSGGKSSCTTGSGHDVTSCSGGYAKPSWQTALTPSDGKRDVPDVSLFSSVGSPSGSFYVICEADLLLPGYTSCNASDPNTRFIGIGGTSASAPSFAGILALVEQKTGARQGNANYVLYKLAAQSGATCASSANPASTCVFYDTTTGTIAMPCAKGSPNCSVSNSADSIGVLSGYAATSGYDLALGLGSVNASNLVNKWTTFANALTPSTTTLTLNGGNPVNITHGQSVGVNIGVTGTPGTPSGNVSLIAETGPNGATDGVQGFVLSSGSASGTTNALPGGTYNVVGQYPGDGTFGSSTSSPPIPVTVAKEASKASLAYELFDPTTGIQTNPNATTATFGSLSLLRMNLTSQAGDACPNNALGDTGCPTGSVTLTDNGNPLDGGTFQLNSQGYAEDQAIDLPGGTHNLAVTYNGDNSFNAASPNPTTQTVTINPMATVTSLEAPATATFGANVELDVYLAAIGSIYSKIGLTGTVAFTAGSKQLGSTPISASVDPSTHQLRAFASVNTTALPFGQNTITAQYSGDASYAASSANGPISVLYPSSAAVTTSSSPVQYGQPVTFTAQVTTTQSSGPAMTGTVSFSTDYGLSLGSPQTLPSNGQVQITTSQIAGGTHNVIAFYSGDANYVATSGIVAETITPGITSTTVASSNSTITQGQSVTLTATITPSGSGTFLPTGTVQFQSNGSNIGGLMNVAGGQAQLQTTSLPVGSDQITAIYSGDSNYSGSTSTAITETVTPAPTFTVTANPTTINISLPGQSGSTMLTFTAQNGFSSNGNVTLTPSMCTGLPSESSCSFNPSTISLATNGTATSTLSIMTTAPIAAAPGTGNHRKFDGWRITGGEVALAFFLCLGIAVFGHRNRQRRWGAVLTLVVLALIFADAGCGGGGSGGGGGGGGNPGTPTGMRAITVSITINGVTQTVPGLTVNVQ